MTTQPQPYVGQQVTVTDARGVRGPGVVTSVFAGGCYKVFVGYRHTDSNGDTADTFEWYFSDQKRSGYGLTIDLTPFVPDATSSEPRWPDPLPKVNLGAPKKGDEVWVKLTLDCDGVDDDGYVIISEAGPYIHSDHIIRHIPAPKPAQTFAPGDRVRVPRFGATWVVVGTLKDGRVGAEREGGVSDVIWRSPDMWERV